MTYLSKGLKEFEEMMERLKPYLPKIPKYIPKPEAHWKIHIPGELPLLPLSPSSRRL